MPIYLGANDATCSFATVVIGTVDNISYKNTGKEVDVTSFGDNDEVCIVTTKKQEVTISVIGMPATVLAVGAVGALSVSYTTGSTAISVANAIVKSVDIGETVGDKIKVTYVFGKTKVA